MAQIKAAFVSTNSIVQGEQTSILWGQMINKYGKFIFIELLNGVMKPRVMQQCLCYCWDFANFDTIKKRKYLNTKMCYEQNSK
jgi:hypothetical protein